MSVDRSIVPIDQIERSIAVIRGQKVILDVDLARCYSVTTKRLNEAVKRNADRFPRDFAFQLTGEEVSVMRSQIATASKRNVRFPPYAFTEHGAIMAATVLNSPQAVRMSVLVVRAFVQMREVLVNHRDLVRQLAELERRLTGHDDAIRHLFTVIRQLLSPPAQPDPPRKPIGFQVRERAAIYRVRKKRVAR